MFALLEHADETGRVERPGNSSQQKPADQAQAKNRPQQQHAGNKKQPAKQVHAAGRPPGAPAQSARAEDYYRAFEHVFRDPSSGVALGW